jgi:hypothetical protein
MSPMEDTMNENEMNDERYNDAGIDRAMNEWLPREDENGNVRSTSARNKKLRKIKPCNMKAK